MTERVCFIETVGSDYIRIVCSAVRLRTLLRDMGARRRVLSSSWTLTYQSERQLASILTALRDHGFAFAGAPAGWPPAAVFENLREKGLTTGPYQEIVWRGPRDGVVSTR